MPGDLINAVVDTIIVREDPVAAEKRERTAKRDRELVLRSLPDGMASVRANASSWKGS